MRGVLGVGRSSEHTRVCPQGFLSLVALCTPWGPAPKHPVQGPQSSGSSTDQSDGQFGLQPRLSQEFRAASIPEV